MKHQSLALLGAASAVMFLGAAAPAGTGAIKSAIQADEKKWNEQFKAKDTEGVLGHYAHDAFFVAPGLKGLDGSKAIRKAYGEVATDPNFSISFASDKVDVASSGDLVYTRGHFSEQFTDPKTKKVMTTGGSYITVYRKQQDGSWKAVEDFAAADPDGTKEAPAAKPAG